VKGFCKFADSCPSPFHSVASTLSRLKNLPGKEKFVQLNEKSTEPWNLQPGGRYFLTRNQSTVIAFAVGGKYQPGNGITMQGAHTDSPCLIVKPRSNVQKNGFQMVGVHTYGGGLWHTWFDRDLSIAGRVISVSEDGTSYKSDLVRVDRPILRVSNLAIHLQTGKEREAFKYNKEDHLIPVLCSVSEAALNKKAEKSDNEDNPNLLHAPLLVDLLASELKITPSRIVDFELCLYDTQKATVGGLLNEFINTARIDNLASCYMLLEAFINSLDTLDGEKNIRMIAFFDDEEVGSRTSRGANSAIMKQVFTRMVGPELVEATIRNSICLSVDCSHGVHPSYAGKHEKHNRPMLNEGLVIKNNPNGRYATTSATSFHLKVIAQKHGIKIQDFVVRNDCPCGSTIGPILAGQLGMRACDVGIAQWSMHSCREVCGANDIEPTIRLLTHYFNEFSTLDTCLEIDMGSAL